MNPGPPPTSDGRGPRSGRHGGRGTGRSGRGSRRTTAPVTPRQRFDGATDELKGEIFDLVGSCSADLFIKTKNQLPTMLDEHISTRETSDEPSKYSAFPPSRCR